MKKLRGTVIIAASAALIAAGLLATAGSAGTNAIAPGNIAFSGLNASDGTPDIFVMKSDGSNRANITQDSKFQKDVSPAWSASGGKIAFTRHNATTSGSHIMVVNADGSGLTNVTSTAKPGSSNIDPSWSRDGKIVFASNRDGNFDLYQIKPGETQAYRLTATSAPTQNVDPAWSPRGDAIVFSRRGHSAVDASADLYQLKLASLQVGRLTNTTKGLGDRGPVFSPSGYAVAFHSDRAGNDDVYVIHLSTSQVQRVATSPKSDASPSYSPDGSSLVFVSNRTDKTELWVQDLRTLGPTASQPFQITSDGQFKSHPSWGFVPAATDAKPALVSAN
jgi:TolB protein